MQVSMTHDALRCELRGAFIALEDDVSCTAVLAEKCASPRSASLGYHQEVRQRTIGILGYGHIGKEIAKRAVAFDMRVIATARSTRSATPEHLAWLGTSDDTMQLLMESDFVVVALPLNDDTEGAIGEKQLEAMKSTAVLINIGRGKVVHEAALYGALKEKRIAGAIIDTWYHYPFMPRKADEPVDELKPSRFPFEELENVIMTPHMSCWTDEHLDRRWGCIAANLDRCMAGSTLDNIVPRPKTTI
ncbi:hypothetical protein CYMTET_20791 [Cymbomonas tetramitiformis]|uniref:D-isomer specific 2-hydroxyacid dehydrogenase NAD-binding domain-containing protein n=1 Tax=Cymbomonas tetramitiformis TaxID=36881 RepID=A0AAE0L3V4_9CHLO|nr:hypothetical protein CYMTET_20791 [Cymbomonas tetramitiformis]